MNLSKTAAILFLSWFCAACELVPQNNVENARSAAKATVYPRPSSHVSQAGFPMEIRKVEIDETVFPKLETDYRPTKKATKLDNAIVWTALVGIGAFVLTNALRSHGKMNSGGGGSPGGCDDSSWGWTNCSSPLFPSQ